MVTETQCGLVTAPGPAASTSVHLLGGPRVLNQSLRRCVVPSQQRGHWPGAWPEPCVNLVFRSHLWRRFLPGWPSSWVLVNVQDETGCWTQTLSYPRSPGSREHSCQMISGAIKFYPMAVNYEPDCVARMFVLSLFLSSQIFSFIDSLFQLSLANYIFCLHPCPFRQY